MTQANEGKRTPFNIETASPQMLRQEVYKISSACDTLKARNAKLVLAAKECALILKATMDLAGVSALSSKPFMNFMDVIQKTEYGNRSEFLTGLHGNGLPK